MALLLPAVCQAAPPARELHSAVHRLPAVTSRLVDHQNSIEALPPSVAPPTPEHPTEGQPSQGQMTREDFEHLALTNHPSIATLTARIHAAQGRMIQAGLRNNPTLSYIGEEIGEGGSAGRQGALITQEFNTAHKRQLARSAAQAEVAQLDQQLEVARRRVLGDVQFQFMEVFFAQRSIEMVSELAALAEQEVRSMNRLREAQEVATFEVLTAQRLLSRIQLQLNESNLALDAAWQRLAAVAGQPDLPRATLAHQLPTAPPTLVWDSTLQNLLASSPELSAALAARETARENVALAHARRYPNFQATAGLLKDTLANETQANVLVGVPLPIFDRNQGGIAASQGQLAAADSEINRLRLQLQRRLAVLFQQYQTAARRVQFFQNSILPNLQQTLELVERGFQEEQLDYLTVIRTRKELIQTKLEYLDAQKQLHSSLTLLNNLLLSGSLDP